jgi:HEAT repeat protein
MDQRTSKLIDWLRDVGPYGPEYLRQAIGLHRVGVLMDLVRALQGCAGPEAIPLVVSLLRDCLKDENYVVRFAVAKALGEFGAAAAPALPDLRECLKDGESLVVSYATEAIKKIQRSSDADAPESPQTSAAL